MELDLFSTDSFSRPYVAMPGRPLNRKYLRVIHEYAPSAVSDTKLSSAISTSRTVSLRSGDIVLVHLTHANGWADGTVLNTGVRGWLPTNYCEGFDHELIRHIYHALTSLWNTCVFSESDPRHLDSSEELQGFVNGVRFLLERTACLHRHSPLVQSNINIYRIRKTLLSDLATLVDYRRAISLDVIAETDRRSWMELYEDYVFKAFRVATRAVRFLDMWLKEELPVAPIFPVRGPMLRTQSDSLRQRLQMPTHVNEEERHALIERNAVLAGPLGLGVYGMENMAASTDVLSIGSATIEPALGSDYDAQAAMVQLELAHAKVQAQIAALLRLPVQSIGSPTVSRTTVDSVESCEKLLAKVILIKSECQSNPSLDKAIKDLTACVTELAAAVRPSGKAAMDEILDLSRGRALILSATGCLKCAKACAEVTRQTLVGVSSSSSFSPSSISPSPVLRSVLSADAIRTSPANRPWSPQASSTLRKQISAGALSPVVTSAHTQTHGPMTQMKAWPMTPAQDDGPPSDWLSPMTQEASNSRPSSLHSTISPTSTRATTPDSKNASTRSPEVQAQAQADERRRPPITVDTGRKLAIKMPAQLIQGTDGRILGGTLAALIECITSEHYPPDPSTMRTFFFTFRSFTTSSELAKALVQRYKNVESAALASAPTKLRVYNMLKHWLEGYWIDADNDALPIIRKLAEDSSIQLLPSARQRLSDLVDRATVASPKTPLLAGFGSEVELRAHSPQRLVVSPPPPTLISRALTKASTDRCSITDFEALEVARQLTLIVSRYYCAVKADELLMSNLHKQEGRSPNVRALARVSTDLANLVTNTVLYTEDAKKRALLLRQWIKIAQSCEELRNYDSLMAIMCAINSSTISRLKRTWAMVTAKTLATIDDLTPIVETTRNYASLRQRIGNAQLPCLPFVGMYLTDLTFVEAGNPDTRPLVADGEATIEVINFDKHVRIVKIIEQFQAYQIPYNLIAVNGLQDWLQAQFQAVRRSDGNDLQAIYQQSLRIEPREDNLRVHLAQKGTNTAVPFWTKKTANLDTRPKIQHVLQKPLEMRPKMHDIIV